MAIKATDLTPKPNEIQFARGGQRDDGEVLAGGGLRGRRDRHDLIDELGHLLDHLAAIARPVEDDDLAVALVKDGREECVRRVPHVMPRNVGRGVRASLEFVQKLTGHLRTSANESWAPGEAHRVVHFQHDEQVFLSGILRRACEGDHHSISGIVVVHRLDRT